MTKAVCVGCGMLMSIDNKGRCYTCYHRDWSVRQRATKELTPMERLIKGLIKNTFQEMCAPSFALSVNAFMWFGSAHFEQYYGFLFRQRDIWHFVAEVINENG